MAIQTVKRDGLADIQPNYGGDLYSFLSNIDKNVLR